MLGIKSQPTPTPPKPITPHKQVVKAPAPQPPAASAKPKTKPEEQEANDDDEYFDLNEDRHMAVLPMHVAGVYHHAAVATLPHPEEHHFRPLAHYEQKKHPFFLTSYSNSEPHYPYPHHFI